MQLNVEQKNAVEIVDTPLMVVAGAGTGKTTVLTERVKHIINSGFAKPSEILALTFTEKAAREMEERIDKALPIGYVQTWISTFHSFGEQILRQEAVTIGLTPNFILLTQAEACLFIKQNLDAFDLSYYRPLGNPTKFIEGLATHFSRLKDEDIDPSRYLSWVEGLNSRTQEKTAEEIAKVTELAKAYQTYEKLKEKNGVMDFGDLIFNTLRLFRQRPDILKRYQENFKYILVDEYQDTNYAQTELAISLASAHRRIAVFLDDDQSIYRFRGAAVYNAMDFRHHFPEGKIVVLTQNYRSFQPILDRAHDLISFNNPDRLEVKENIDKRLTAQRGAGLEPLVIWEDRGEDEAEAVVQEIERLVQFEGKESHTPRYTYRDVAILVRANNHADQFVQALTRKGIPFQFLGPGQLYNRPEIKDLLAYFKFLADISDDLAMYRLLTKRFFGIDRKDIATISAYAQNYNITLFQTVEKIVAAQEVPEELISIQVDTREKLEKLHTTLVRHFDRLPDYSPGQLLYFFLEDTGLLRLYQQPQTDMQQKEILNISRFFDEIKSFESRQTEPTIHDWLEYIEYVWAQGESPLASEIDWSENDAVTILTVHSAKGLEFPVVFLVNVVNDRFPTRNRSDQVPIPDELAQETLPEGNVHIEEERRLFYVGMTRAKDVLYLTGAKFYGENKRPKKLSGFVSEALGEDLSSFFLTAARSQPELPLFGEFAPEKTVPSQDIATSKHQVDYLTYSRINAFQICPLHYYLQFVVNVPTPVTGALSFGTAMHNTMKQFYQWVLLQKLEHVPLESELTEQISAIFAQQWISRGYNSKEQEKRTYAQGESWLHDYVKKQFNPEILPIDIEKPFTINIDDFKVGGRIDRVDRYPDGTLEILDYKTGVLRDANALEKDLQLAIYALAITDTGIYNQPLEQLKLAFYYFEAGEKISISITWERLQKAKEEIREIKQQIEQSNFKCTQDFICQNGCEYSLFCDRR